MRKIVELLLLNLGINFNTTIKIYKRCLCLRNNVGIRRCFDGGGFYEAGFRLVIEVWFFENLTDPFGLFL